MPRWLIEDVDGTLYDLTPAPYMLDSISFFAVEVKALYIQGRLFASAEPHVQMSKNRNRVFLFRSEQSYPFLEFDHISVTRIDDKDTALADSNLVEINIRSPVHATRYSRTVLNTIERRLYLAMDHCFYNDKCDVLGPVSFTELQDEKEQQHVLLFGDVHDDLEIHNRSHLEPYDDAYVKNMFQDFFGSTKSFFESKTSFDQFEFMVNKMKMALGDPESLAEVSGSRELFIWEFLVVVLHLCSMAEKDATVDVIVEDMREMDFEPTNVTNYLLAVRHLFTICPTDTPFLQSSPFAGFLPRCKALFPNLAYHRVDLRYAVHEDAQGSFLHDTPVAVCTSLIVIMRYVTQNQFDRDWFNIIMKKAHKLKNAADQDVLWEAISLMIEAVKKVDYVFNNFVQFMDVFAEAVQLYYVREPDATKWFLFRTCVMDIYGLCLLCASKNPKAVVYVGDYHAKVWRDVLTKRFAFSISKQQDVGLSRVIQFDAKTTKPLMTRIKWNDENLDFIFQREWGTLPLNIQSAFIIQFYMMRKFSLYPEFVQYFARQWNRGDPLQLKKVLPDSMLVHTSTIDAKMWQDDLENVAKLCPGETADVLMNEFTEMTRHELESIYKRDNGDCVSAQAMYDWWQKQASEGQVFRDPFTRTRVSQEEQRIILNKALILHAPHRHENATDWWQDVRLQFYPQVDVPNSNKLVHFINRVELHTSRNEIYFVCFLKDEGSLNDSLLLKMFDALKETLRHANHLTMTADHRIESESIHFNNYQNPELWLPENARETLVRLKDELEPYTSVSF